MGGAPPPTGGSVTLNQENVTVTISSTSITVTVKTPGRDKTTVISRISGEVLP